MNIRFRLPSWSGQPRKTGYSRRLDTILFAIVAWAALSTAGAALDPPVARKKPRITEVHGDRRVDDYFWLREKSNPEVAAYLNHYQSRGQELGVRSQGSSRLSLLTPDC